MRGHGLAYDQNLCTAVHRALAAALRQRTRTLARAHGHGNAQTGSVTFMQRYGGGLNLNVHFHLLGLDGWFYRGGDQALQFARASAPCQARGDLHFVITAFDSENSLYVRHDDNGIEPVTTEDLKAMVVRPADPAARLPESSRPQPLPVLW